MGFEWGSQVCAESQNGYVTVIRSYLSLHLWHRREALLLTDIAHLFQLPLTFSTEQEVQALRAVLGAVGTACLLKVAPGARGRLQGLSSIVGQLDYAAPDTTCRLPRPIRPGGLPRHGHRGHIRRVALPEIAYNSSNLLCDWGHEREWDSGDDM